MAKGLDSELLGVGAWKALGWTQSRLVEISDNAMADGPGVDERAIGRVAHGRTNPQSRTRLLMLPISAEILGLSCEAIAREIYWRETYDRLSDEIKNGGTPVALEGFVLMLRELREGDDAGSAWNYAMAPFMEPDLTWDAMTSEAMVCLGGRTRREVRQSCALQFKVAYDRFAAFARKVRTGVFQLAKDPARLIAARADSMRAAAAEQLFSLALLNEEHDWRLVRNEDGAPLTVEWAASLLPSQTEVTDFSSTLQGFLPGSGWLRRISNNEAVLTLAIASAAVGQATSHHEPAILASLKAAVAEAIATLLRPCDGERVSVRSLPTYRRLLLAGLVEAPDQTVTLRSRRSRAVAGSAVAILAACLVYLTPESPAARNTPRVDAPTSEFVVAPADFGKQLRIAGPGGTRPTVLSAIGPGGTVVTDLTA